MQQIYLDDFHLHSTTTRLPYSVHANIQGIDAPSLRLDSYNNPGADGETTANALFGGRLIVLEGYVEGDTIATYRAAREALSRLAIPLKGPDRSLQARMLTFTDLRGQTFTIPVVVSAFHNNDTYPLFSEWQLQLKALDHRIYSTTIQSQIITLPISGGYSFPYDIPYTFGGSSGGAVVVRNDGTISTPPIIKIFGPIENPIITNLTTGEHMALTLQLLSGDEVTIDTGIDRTIIQGTSTNRMGAKTSDSSFWHLDPDDNQITLSASTYDVGYAQLLWRSALAGF